MYGIGREVLSSIKTAMRSIAKLLALSRVSLTFEINGYIIFS